MDDFTLSVAMSHETRSEPLSAANWTVGPDLRLTSWNGGGLVPTRAAPDIIPGRHIAEILRAYGIDRIALSAHERALEGLDTQVQVKAEGREFRASLTPLRNGSARVIGVVGVAVEVTDPARETERARLERFVAEYKALADFSAEIETIHDTDELIEYGMERLLQAFKFDAAMFTEVRDDALHYERLRGLTTKELIRTLRVPQPLGAGVNGQAAVTRQALYVDDYPNWEARYEPYVASGVQSMLALPVHRNGQVVHTLSFATLNRRAELDQNAVRIAGGFVRRLENAFERTQHLEEIKATREATFRSLGLALEYRDLETRGHTDRVVELSRRFAAGMDLDHEECQALAWGAYLHDLGKVAVPDAILLKTGRLTDEEFDIIRQHTIYGVEMTRDIAFLPTATVEVIRSHHERWDGYGYPDRLAGEDIPLLARMFSLVDVYDALTSERPYKNAWTHAEAVAEIQKQAGRQFDPRLVPRFLATLAEGTNCAEAHEP